jgi:hypothetical protein
MKRWTGSREPVRKSAGCSRRRSAEVGGELPVAIDVAVVVEAAGEAGALEGLDVDAEVLLGQPRRSRRLIFALRPLRRPLLSGRQRPADVARERRVGRAGLLEPDDVEVVTERFAQQPRRRSGRARQEGHAHVHHGGDPIGSRERELPHHDCAPVVPDEGSLLFAQVIEQANHVLAHGRNVIGLDGCGDGAPAVAAHVRRDGSVARIGKRGQLVAPRVPELGKAVAEDHRPSLADLRHVELDAVRRHLPVADGGRPVVDPHRQFGRHRGGVLSHARPYDSPSR